MKRQEITEAERVERVCNKLLEKARARKPGSAAGPLLGPPGFVLREFFDDLRELSLDLRNDIEEYALVLEEAAFTGKIGNGRVATRESRSAPERMQEAVAKAVTFF